MFRPYLCIGFRRHTASVIAWRNSWSNPPPIVLNNGAKQRDSCEDANGVHLWRMPPWKRNSSSRSHQMQRMWLPYNVQEEDKAIGCVWCPLKCKNCWAFQQSNVIDASFQIRPADLWACYKLPVTYIWRMTMSCDVQI